MPDTRETDERLWRRRRRRDDDDDASSSSGATETTATASLRALVDTLCEADEIEWPAVSTERFLDPQHHMRVVGCSHLHRRRTRDLVRVRSLRVTVDGVLWPWTTLLRHATRPLVGDTEDNPAYGEHTRCRDVLLDEMDQRRARGCEPLLRTSGLTVPPADAAATTTTTQRPLEKYFVAVGMRGCRHHATDTDTDTDTGVADDEHVQHALALGRQLTPMGYAALCTYGAQLALEPEYWSDVVLPFEEGGEAHDTVRRHLTKHQLLCDLTASRRTSRRAAAAPHPRGEVVLHCEELMLELGSVFRQEAGQANPLQHVVWARDALRAALLESRAAYQAHVRASSPHHVDTLRRSRVRGALAGAEAPPADALHAALQWHADASERVRDMRLLFMLLRAVDAFLCRAALLGATFRELARAARTQRRAAQRATQEAERRRRATEARREAARRAQDEEVAAFARRLAADPAPRTRSVLPPSTHDALRAWCATHGSAAAPSRS